jgi:glycosyltransferase involved in cell wall biosynthesis
MKICLLNNLFPPFNRGGAETVVANQAEKFTNQGHDVFIITTKPLFNSVETQFIASQLTQFIASPSLRIYRFSPFNLISYYHLNKLPLPLRALWRLLDVFNFHSYFKIKKILLTEKPDVIYAHNLTGLGLLIPRLIKKLKIKYIQTMHDVVAIRPSGLLIYGEEKENIFIKIWVKLNHWLYNSPDEIHFPSLWLKNFYASHDFFPASKKEIIPNFPLPSSQDLLTNKKLKTPGRLNLLFIGQIEKHKGILFLIKALNTLPIIHNTCPIIHLHVLGSGSALPAARQLAVNNPHIKFLGRQPREKIKEFLQQADYTIIPSLCYENSPTVIFESLNAGVPVIASGLGGIPELIKAGETGYLFRPGGKDNLLSLLKML